MRHYRLRALGLCLLVCGSLPLLGGLAAFAQKKMTGEPYHPAPSRYQKEGSAQHKIRISDKARVVRLPIEGTIDLGLAYFIRRSIEREEKRAGLILLDINTLGGRVDAAIQIRDALLNARVPTVAFVHPRAISAGALIALACDVIAISPGGTMGAATPIVLGQGGEPAQVSEKMISYMRTEMRATAEAKKRRGDIAEAMVDPTVEIEGVNQTGKLLTLDSDRAFKLHMVDMQASHIQEVLDKVGATKPILSEREMSWAEHLTRFFTEPVVSGLLMSLGTIALLIELYHPGVGLPGAIAVLSLGLFFGGHLLVHLAGWEELLLLVAGLMLVLAEIFLIPGFGVAGILGGVALFSSFVLALIGLPLDVSVAGGMLTKAVNQVLISVIATFVGLIIAFRFMPMSVRRKGLILNESTSRDEGFVSTGERYDALVGHEGVALTDLRPAGKVQVGERTFDVVSEGAFIERGSSVIVAHVEGARIVVRSKQ